MVECCMTKRRQRLAYERAPCGMSSCVTFLHGDNLVPVALGDSMWAMSDLFDILATHRRASHAGIVFPASHNIIIATMGLPAMG